MSEFVYIARRPCGCVTGFAVDDPTFAKETAKDVAKFIESGCSVERVTLEVAHATKYVSKCAHVPQSASSAGLPAKGSGIGEIISKSTGGSDA